MATSDMNWEECKRALQAAQQEQQAAWGNVDEFAIARYLCGESTDEERKVVEQEIASHPKLAECITHIRRVFNG